MVITRLERPEQVKATVGKSASKTKKIRVYIDEVYSFYLYGSDLSDYGLEEGRELPEEVYHELLWEVIFPRGKEKALNLLKFRDRTEAELLRRLTEEGYPQLIIQRVISYVMDYGYLNDERYASNYIKLRKSSKSRLVLMAELTAKGISKELINQVFATEYEEQEEDPEQTAILKAIHKKTQDPSTLNREEKQKLMSYLYPKGFSTEKINKALQVSQE